MLPVEQQGLFVNKSYALLGHVFIGGAKGRRYLAPFGVSVRGEHFDQHRLIPCDIELASHDLKKFERVSPGNLVEWND